MSEDPFEKGLEDLGTVPDRATIEVLSMLAEDALGDPSNVSAVCGTLLRRISSIDSQRKLPLLYLLDFISKNLGAEFQSGFAPMLPSVVVSAYRSVSPENQASMRRMMLTWRDQSLYLPQLSEISANVGGLGFEITPSASNGFDGMNPAKRQRVDQSMQSMQQYLLPGQPQPGMMMMMPGYPTAQNQFAYGSLPQQMMMPYGGMQINPQMTFFQQQQQQQQQMQMQQMQQMQHLLNVQQTQLYAQQVPSVPVGAAPLPVGYSIPSGMMPSGPLLPSRQNLSATPSQPVLSSTDISAALLAERNPGVDIAFSLYKGLYFRCSKCALRFKEAEDLSIHANDHIVELKAALVQGTSSRNWYLPESEWDTCRVRHFETIPSASGLAKEASSSENKTNEGGLEGQVLGISVRVSELPADHLGTCRECGEKITKRFDDKSEAWVFEGAVFTPPNLLAHVACVAIPKE
jgi:hypothetical protein